MSIPILDIAYGASYERPVKRLTLAMLSIKYELTMHPEFASDLRLARRKAGLTQLDCAHLLGITQAKLSDLEKGKQLPTLEQICILAVIYDRTFESLYSELVSDARGLILFRLETLPECKERYVATYNRANTLRRMKHRLAAKPTPYADA